MAELNAKFLTAHNANSAHPLIATAEAANQKSPLLNVKPVLSDPPLMRDFLGALFLMSPNSLFCAITPATPAGLQFLQGARLDKPEIALEELKAAVVKKIPTLTWTTTTSGLITSAKTSIPEIGNFQLAAGKNWLLLGTDTAAFAHAIKVLTTGKADIASLSNVASWKSSLSAQPEQPLFIYYSQIDQLPPPLDAGGMTALAQLLRTRLGGMQALSWSWNTTGQSDRQAYDRFVVTLAPATAQSAQRLLPALPAMPPALVGPDTVFYFTLQGKVSELIQTPALAGLSISALIQKGITHLNLEGKAREQSIPALLLVDHDKLEPRTAWVVTFPSSANVVGLTKAIAKDAPPLASRVIAFAGSRANHLIIADDTASADYFRARLTQVERTSASTPPAPQSSLPIIDRPFLILGLERDRLVNDLIVRLKKDASVSLAALKKCGLLTPEAYADFKPETYLGPMQMSASIRGNQVILDNYFQLRGSASTNITATTILGVQVYGPQIESLMAHWQSLFQPNQARETGSDAFTTCYESSFLFGPLMTGPKSYSVGLDLMTHFYLSTLPKP
ncbi:MAG: hypothetical protein B9S32_15240 [Verrucomicrobia bacterium Tous-C9LFEB]|nr:MAG: hypothetical protein B9S32_15240 [Verrucomicrobia bacterium Tous-C9LFEB]